LPASLRIQAERTPSSRARWWCTSSRPCTPRLQLEAHLFSQAIDDFKAANATGDRRQRRKIEEMAPFSNETEHCGGKFAVAADPARRSPFAGVAAS
jgi:hypothetical protein